MKEKFDKKLLVEGKNDMHVVYALCKYFQVPENFDVVDCGSKEGVLAQLKLRLKDPLKNKVIGVVLDADTNINNSWASIESVLKQTSNYDSSKIVLNAGGSLIHAINGDESSVGVWLMPDNKVNGMLEDFILCLAPVTDVLMHKAEETLVVLEKDKIHRYKDVHRSKAKIHTFLAWNDEPGLPMGSAITARVLDPSLGSAKIFVDWLERCFE